MNRTKFSRQDESGKEAAGKGFWSRAKDRYALTIAGAALAASLAAGCGRTGLLAEPQAPPQNDGGVSDSGIVDSGPTQDSGSDGGTQLLPLWEGKNLIGDHLDRTLGDREAHTSALEMASAYPIGGSDTNENANPFTDGNGGTIGPSEVFLHRIGAAQAPVFADASLSDSKSGTAYMERQDIWLSGDNRFEQSEGSVIGDLRFLAYTLRFDGPGQGSGGIPVCTSADGTDYSACMSSPPTGGTSYADSTESHRLSVRFLGSDWIVTGMEAPSQLALADDHSLVKGGSLRLGREAVSATLGQDDYLIVDGLKFRFDDIESSAGSTAMVLSVLDANDNVLKMDKVLPGQTKQFQIDGKAYPFHLYNAASGMGGMWASCAILSQELELRDGSQLDPDNGLNPAFKVALGWKNIGGSPSASRPDSLRTVAVYSDTIEEASSSGDSRLLIGDYVPLMQSPAEWRLMYTGLDLQSDERSELRIELRRSDLVLAQVDGVLQGQSVQCTVKAPYIRVSSSASGPVFSSAQLNGGSLSDDGFVVPLSSGVSCEAQGFPLPLGKIFMKQSPSSSAWGLGSALISYGAIGNQTPGQGVSAGGTIFVDVPGGWSGVTSVLASSGADCQSAPCIDPAGNKSGVPDAYIGVFETDGSGASSQYRGFFVIGVDGSGTGDPADATLSFDSHAKNGFILSSAGKALYGHATPNGFPSLYGGPFQSGPVQGGIEAAEPPYVSERGSMLVSVSENEVRLSMAKRLANAVWRLVGK